MASEVAGGMMTHLFPSVGPALMISMGYIDLAKWVATIEGGARFGFDLVFLVLFFNCIAILCQYLSTCIGMAAGKNLAEICSEEYCGVLRILLGVQAELSMIISDITMILGIGHGLSLLFGMDLFACIFYATVGIVLLPSFFSLLDNCKAEALYIVVAGVTLLFYVFGVLISQPDFPFTASVVFPKLSGDSAYSVMALLGANIMAHNFYIHSSIVKQQKRQPSVSMGALFHDHFFATLFIFTGIFLVNYVLMNSAAVVFGSADVAFNLQDVSMLMDQIFRSPVAPFAFFLVLFFSSQITALTRNIGGQVIFQCFFGINLPWIHHVVVKALTIIPTLYYAKSAGAEGTYQLLIYCQVILAMLLPSSVIPLFRVASSRFIMRSFRMPWYLEIFALVAFLVMFASNIFFIIEMLFGNNSWMINLTESTESTAMIPYAILLIIACASIGLTLYLAITPLKSASDRSETHIWPSNLQKDQPKLSEVGENNNVSMIKYDENQESSVEDALEKSMYIKPEKSMMEDDPDLPEAATDSDHESQRSAHSSSLTLACTSPKSHPEESKSADEVESIDTSDKASTCFSDVGIYERIESKDHVVKGEPEPYTQLIRDNDRSTVEPEGSFKGFPLSTSQVPVPFNNAKSKGLESLDGPSGSGSLSKLSGLGRAARRQLASILDEFWGNLFDFHGKLTQEAATNRLDVLLGLDLRTVGSPAKADAIGTVATKSFFPDTDMGSIFPTNARDYNSPNRVKNHSVDQPFGVQMGGSSSWSQNIQALNSHAPSSSNNLLNPSDRLYSSLHLPQYSDSRDYQPATIHGYQIASYLREIGATRSPYSSSISPNLLPTLNSASSIPTLSDQVLFTRAQNELGALGTSGLQNPPSSRVTRLQAEAPCFEPSFGGARDSTVCSANAKKYHSSPDISALIALGRNAYLNEAKRGAPIGPPPSAGRMISEQSQYTNAVSRPGVALAFDQLSPPKLHSDVFSLNSDTKSLWSRQPFEQFFGVEGKGQRSSGGVSERRSIPSKETFPYAESGTKLLQSLRFCIMKLLKLEGSDWLFRQNGGSDEELIDRIAALEKYSQRVDNGEFNQVFSGGFNQLSSDRKFCSLHRSEEADIPFIQSVPNCGDRCVWGAALVVSFGVWCIHRILELSLIESRPELWGKYTYVLNRLQGIVEPAFSKTRLPISPCFCLETSTEDARSFNGSSLNGLRISKPLTNATMVLEIIKDVEIAVSGRKGRTGTAAGDVAFPKGKENLASVLKRYKRRLQNKNQESATTSRKIPSSASSSAL